MLKNSNVRTKSEFLAALQCTVASQFVCVSVSPFVHGPKIRYHRLIS